MPIERSRLENLRKKYRAELYDRVLPFWLAHSPDRECGGTFNCLDRDGAVWDDRKYIWLLARQVWMFAKLYNTADQREDWLEMARLGMDFLRQHAIRPDNRCYFSLTREGAPHHIQRKIFSESFYAMALSEYARATGDERLRLEARLEFEAIVGFAEDPRLVGRPVYDHLPATSSLAVPMILLNLIDEIHDPDETTYDAIARDAVDEIDLHIRPELELVLEHVGADGSLLDTPEGRVVNPGHAIEAGWFLLQYARKRGDKELVGKAINMAEWCYAYGWDKEYGGIYYFLDREGRSPSQLEWSMKLWWPHNEAQIAFLMAYQVTGDAKYFKLFEQVTDFAFGRFSDSEYGEWFGYLDRAGERTHTFKGGPYKGCFHVPRALFFCERMLGELLEAGG